MQAFWTDKKPDGTPITDGRLCRVVDPEDGSTPVRVYGRTQEEVFSKIERTMMTAQSTLSQARQPQNGNGNGNHAQPVAASKRPVLSADDTMKLTADLHNPQKSAEASWKLQESENNKRLNAQDDYLAVCRAFAPRHPEFFNHKTNRTLLINKALLTAGQDISLITAAVLDRCYAELVAADALLTENEVRPAETQDEPLPSTVQPGGSPGPVPVRPAGGVTSTTSHRSSRLGAPAAPQWKPKLTQEEINRLTTKDTDAILRGTHPKIARKDYDEACDYWFPKAQATA